MIKIKLKTKARISFEADIPFYYSILLLKLKREYIINVVSVCESNESLSFKNEINI